MATQEKIFDAELVKLDLNMWLEFGKRLLDHDKYVRSTNRCMQWDIGDWLVEGEDFGVKKKVMKTKEFKRLAVQTTGYGWNSLKNLMSIARLVEEPQRRDGREGRRFLDYNIHVAVAKFDPKTQEELLAVAERAAAKGAHNEPLVINDRKVKFSVKTFRDYIAVKQKKGELPPMMGWRGKQERLRPSDAVKGLYVRVFLGYDDYEKLSVMALGKYAHTITPDKKDKDAVSHGHRQLDTIDYDWVGILLKNFAVSYANESKDEIKALLEAGRARLESMKEKNEESLRLRKGCLMCAKEKPEQAAD